jgi:hypothetical protein
MKMWAVHAGAANLWKPSFPIMAVLPKSGFGNGGREVAKVTSCRGTAIPFSGQTTATTLLGMKRKLNSSVGEDVLVCVGGPGRIAKLRAAQLESRGAHSQAG